MESRYLEFLDESRAQLSSQMNDSHAADISSTSQNGNTLSSVIADTWSDDED